MAKSDLTSVNPKEISYRIIGEWGKTPLVCLHGLMGFAGNWGKMWPHFQKERQILVLDQRGHGKSPKPPAGYAPDDYASDLKNLLSLLGWKKIHLLGHSMGGRVAMHFAARYPELVQTLILEDSGAEARKDRLDWIQNLLKSVPTPFPNREAAKMFFDTHFEKDPMVGGFLHANLVSLDDGSMDWKFFPPGMIETIAKGRILDAMDLFSKLVLPILIVRGERSEEFLQDEAERMAKAAQNAELVVIAGAGHLVHAEKPEAFSNAVSAFISAHEPA
jgi:esterase